MMTINIANEFTRVPGPRYRYQGEGSGQQFREEYLKPAFRHARQAGERLVVQLDGVKYGYPTSFLEEAFGGLTREFGRELVLETLRFESTAEPLLDYEIKRYIERAESTASKHTKVRVE